VYAKRVRTAAVDTKRMAQSRLHIFVRLRHAETHPSPKATKVAANHQFRYGTTCWRSQRLVKELRPTTAKTTGPIQQRPVPKAPKIAVKLRKRAFIHLPLLDFAEARSNSIRERASLPNHSLGPKTAYRMFPSVPMRYVPGTPRRPYRPATSALESTITG